MKILLKTFIFKYFVPPGSGSKWISTRTWIRYGILNLEISDVKFKKHYQIIN